MDKQLFEKVEDFIFDIAYEKVSKAFENVTVRYGTIVKLPEFTQDDWTAIHQFGEWALELAQESYYQIYENAVYTYLNRELKSKVAPGFYRVRVLVDEEGETKAVIDLNFDELVKTCRILSYHPILTVKEGKHTMYFVSKPLKKNPVNKHDYYWVELTAEEAQMATQAVRQS